MSESPEAAELNAKVGKTPEETLREALAWLDFAADSDNLGDADRKRLARQKPAALEALASLRQRQEERERFLLRVIRYIDDQDCWYLDEHDEFTAKLATDFGFERGGG